MPLDMDSTFDRFKVTPKGGHFATTTYNESTFKTMVSINLCHSNPFVENPSSSSY